MKYTFVFALVLSLLLAPSLGFAKGKPPKGDDCVLVPDPITGLDVCYTPEPPPVG